MYFVNVNDLQKMSLADARKELTKAGYVPGTKVFHYSYGYNECWVLRKDPYEIVMDDSPLANGHVLHCVCYVKNHWLDFDNGAVMNDDGHISPVHYLSYYSLVNCDIDLPYEVIAAWDDMAYIFILGDKVNLILIEEDEPTGYTIFQRDKDSEVIQNLIDVMREAFGDPDWFYSSDTDEFYDLWQFVNVLKVWAGGEYLYLFAGEICTVDADGTKSWGSDSNEHIAQAIEYIRDKHYESV